MITILAFYLFATLTIAPTIAPALLVSPYPANAGCATED
jgi:hypothetical protein